MGRGSRTAPSLGAGNSRARSAAARTPGWERRDSSASRWFALSSRKQF